MDFEIFGSMFSALQGMFAFEIMMYLFAGVLCGLILGVIPGLGGLTGLSLLLPFAFTMEPMVSFVFIMGLYAITTTSDTIPAVLFGVPGTIGSAATVMDGYPMSKRGEAGRALGAAFTASAIGGIFGAMLLAVSVPILRPVVVQIASPQMLAICIFGLSLVSVLSSGNTLKGLAIACIGVVLATVGEDVHSGTFRWTWNSLYLYDGLPIVPIALGLFALPEMIDLLRSGQSVAGNAKHLRRGQWDGIKDTIRNWFLVLRCSAIGSTLGSIPGIGSAIIDWVAYAHVKRTTKGDFGNGDVRGVIAPEAANNAKEGGALIPTITFGVPGSVGMILVLSVLVMHGYYPGPDMLGDNINVTYTLVWALALANIIGAAICFGFSGQLAKLTLIRPIFLVPCIVIFCCIGAYQATESYYDIIVMVIAGVFGWIMKQLGWSRPCLILGFVLGSYIERYMFISYQRYGWEWLYSPVVAGILLVTLYGVVAPFFKNKKQVDPESGHSKRAFIQDFVFTTLLTLLCILIFLHSTTMPFSAGIVPGIMGGFAMIFLTCIVGWQYYKYRLDKFN